MTFEQWWADTYGPDEGPFKEVARKAWNAARAGQEISATFDAILRGRDGLSDDERGLLAEAREIAARGDVLPAMRMTLKYRRAMLLLKLATWRGV